MVRYGLGLRKIACRGKEQGPGIWESDQILAALIATADVVAILFNPASHYVTGAFCCIAVESYMRQKVKKVLVGTAIGEGVVDVSRQGVVPLSRLLLTPQRWVCQYTLRQHRMVCVEVQYPVANHFPIRWHTNRTEPLSLGV